MISGISSLKHPLHTHAQSHLRHGAAAAGAHQLDLDDARGLVDIDQLDVAAVVLQSRTDAVQCLLDSIFHVSLLASEPVQLRP